MQNTKQAGPKKTGREPGDARKPARNNSDHFVITLYKQTQHARRNTTGPLALKTQQFTRPDRRLQPRRILSLAPEMMVGADKLAFTFLVLNSFNCQTCAISSYHINEIGSTGRLMLQLPLRLRLKGGTDEVVSGLMAIRCLFFANATICLFLRHFKVLTVLLFLFLICFPFHNFQQK